jgi:membrane-bound metal-dependent hydrolase YbcI (DUF457 family)
LAGAAYAVAVWQIGGMPPSTCILGGVLCVLAGMLPDLDSGEEDSLRESIGFAAAVVPLLMIHRLQQAGLSLEAIVLAGAGLYLAVRYGAAWLVSKYSDQRGMLHSLPAAAVAGQVAFLSFSTEEPIHRYFVASSVVLGFLVHLILDEIWSVKEGQFGPKFKTSFGTEAWSNLLSYVLVVALGVLSATDAHWSEKTLPARQYARQQMEQAARSMPSTPAPWNYRR